MLQTSLAPPGLGSRGTELVPSALSRRLGVTSGSGAATTAGSAPRPGIAEAFAAARRTVLASQRLDMGALAAALGVDRTSLFRWVGSRDALLSEVLWSVAAPTLDATDHAARDLRGAPRVVEVLTGFVDAMITAAFFRDLLAREPVRALRLLTTAAGPVQARFTAVVEHLLAREVQAGALRPALPLHDLAYLLVRVAESFTYADLLAGEQPDATRARRAFALLLQEVPA